MKRFAFVSTKKYASPDAFRDVFEDALRDISSPLRINSEIGLDYNIYKNFCFGFSLVTFFEHSSGKALARGDYTDEGYEVIIYDFKRSRIGQTYNINLSLHF
jgi:hypothetical protein